LLGFGCVDIFRRTGFGIRKQRKLFPAPKC